MEIESFRGLIDGSDFPWHYIINLTFGERRHYIYIDIFDYHRELLKMS